jgi:hypothetical protein
METIPKVTEDTNEKEWGPEKVKIHKKKILMKENRNLRKGRGRGSTTRKNRSGKRSSNKIMNSNIVNQNVYSGVTKGKFSKPSTLELPSQDKTQLDLIYNSNPVKHSQEQVEQKMFGDFKNKFFEANLNKIISWEELKSIAMAIGNRDWAYVKYILTIICLMLKSYQNISKDNFSNEKNKSNENESVTNVIDKMKKMDISPTNDYNKENVCENETKSVNESTIREQLQSLNNIFKKMKNIEVQMNISNCWSCYNNLCVLHPLKTHITPGSGFKTINIQDTASINVHKQLSNQ